MLHQMILNADGRRRAPSIVGYASSAAHHQRESYTSEMVEYISNSQSPRIISGGSSNYSPKKATNNYKERPEAHSPGSPFLVPWMSSPRKSSSSSPKYYNGNKPSERFHGMQDYHHGKSNNNREENDQYYEAGRGQGDQYYSDDDDNYEEHDDDHNVKAGKNNRVSFRDDYNSRMVKADYDNKGNDKSSYYDQQGSYRTRDEGKYYDDRNYSPRSNKPKKETTYYEMPSHGSPRIGNINNNNSGLAPIRTRPNTNNPPNHREMEYYPNNGVVHRMDPMQQRPAANKYYSSPKPKDEETIDSNEARRRYASKSSPWAQHVAEESYTHTIDSREAARRYNGVFVP